MYMYVYMCIVNIMHLESWYKLGALLLPVVQS